MNKLVIGKINSACNIELVDKVAQWISENKKDYPASVVVKKGLLNQIFFEVDDEKVALLTDPDVKATLHFDSDGTSVDDLTIKIKSLDLSKNEIIFDFSILEKEIRNEIPTTNEAAEKVIKNGILTKEEVEKRLKILEQNKVPQSLISKVFEFILENGKQENVNDISYWYVPSNKNEFFVADYLGACIRGNSLLLAGGQSTGKSLYAKTIAYLLNLPCAEQVIGQSQTQEDIISPKTTDNSAADELQNNKIGAVLASFIEGGSSVSEMSKIFSMDEKTILNELSNFKLNSALATSPRVITEITPLVRMVQVGGILILNEINYADCNELAATLNPLLDGTGYIIVPGIGKVKIHKNFRIIGTYNPNFEGTKELNQALCSRFTKFEVGYAKNTLEIFQQAIKDKRLGIDGKDLDINALTKLSTLFNQIVEGYKSRVWGDAAISIRGFARAYADYISDGTPLYRAICMEVINHCEMQDIEKLREKASLLFPV